MIIHQARLCESTVGLCFPERKLKTAVAWVMQECVLVEWLWLAFSIQLHITDFRPLTHIKQCIQRHFIHCKRSVFLHKERKGAVHFETRSSAELTDPCVSTLAPLWKNISPFCASAFNKTGRAAVIMSIEQFFSRFRDYFISARQHRWRLLTVRGLRKEKEPSFSSGEESFPSQPFIILAPVNGF